MKSPGQLTQKLAQQWQSAQHREQRLLGEFHWPIRLTIGRPGASDLKYNATKVQTHLQAWRQESIGEVQWAEVSYQSASKPVTIPQYWFIHSPSEWIAACHKQSISKEFEILSEIVSQTEAQFHSFIVRHRSLWLNHPARIIIQCTKVALQLKPGMAAGRPLRAIAIIDMDSKFLETYQKLLVKLLNIRYGAPLNSKTRDEQIKDEKTRNLEIISLEQFLDAAEDKKQWLLLIPLSANLLPYQQLRLRASELASLKLPGSHLLIIENEQCRYHLPPLENTIAILGAGLNLSWMNNPDFQDKKVAYWGDIDTWGLKMLAMARRAQPKLCPLLMNQNIFQKHQQYAVPEPQNAGESIPQPLTEDETQLYQQLIQLADKKEKNRLEQEFIPAAEAKESLLNWYAQTRSEQ